MPIDIKVDKFNGKEYFDIDIDTNGDFKTVDSYETASLLSVFAERRATSAEISNSLKRRGWIGNESNPIPNFELGSKLWTIIEQGRINSDTRNKAIAILESAYQWFIDDNHATNVIITGEVAIGDIIINIDFIIPEGDTFSQSIGLWETFARN